jgi:hypothetical protein
MDATEWFAGSATPAGSMNALILGVCTYIQQPCFQVLQSLFHGIPLSNDEDNRWEAPGIFHENDYD